MSGENVAKYPVFASKWIELREAAGWSTKALEAEGFTQFSTETREENALAHRALYRWQKGEGRPTGRHRGQLVDKLAKAGYPKPAAEQIIEHLMNEAFPLAEFRRMLQPQEPLDLTNPVVAQWRSARQQEKDQKRILAYLEWLENPANWEAARAEAGDGPAGKLLEQIRAQNERSAVLRKLETLDRQIEDSLD